MRQWVRDWRDDPRVSREESYRQVTGEDPVQGQRDLSPLNSVCEPPLTCCTSTSLLDQLHAGHHRIRDRVFTSLLPYLFACVLSAALQELGDFYLAKGQRALPSSELINSLKGKLQAAEASLPKKS